MTEKAVKLKCISQVRMTSSGKISFIGGKVYEGYQDSQGRIRATNEQGNEYHQIKHIDGLPDEWFNEHFSLIETCDYALTLLKSKKNDLESLINSAQNRISRQKKLIQQDEIVVEHSTQQLKEINSAIASLSS